MKGEITDERKERGEKENHLRMDERDEKEGMKEMKTDR
jgi:hypothetical protein